LKGQGPDMWTREAVFATLLLRQRGVRGSHSGERDQNHRTVFDSPPSTMISAPVTYFASSEAR
jgi:hypothetical protein